MSNLPHTLVVLNLKLCAEWFVAFQELQIEVMEAMNSVWRPKPKETLGELLAFPARPRRRRWVPVKPQHTGL